MLKTISTGSRDGNCYLLSDGNEGLLLDCGCKFSEILKGIDFNPSKISGCLITHEHGDHCKSVKRIAQYGIPCYAGFKTQEFIKENYGEVIAGIPGKQWQTAGRFKFCGFSLPHDGTYNLGYLIELPDGAGRLIYATDFEYFPNTFRNAGVNFWLIECNYCEDLLDKQEIKYEHSIRGHCSLGTCQGIVKANKTLSMRNIVLCHLSETWSDQKEMLQSVKEITGDEIGIEIAKPGCLIPLKLYPWE